MNPPVRRARTFSAALCSVVAVATASGQGNRDLATAHSQAMAEFQAGNYAKAATDLEALVARVEVTPQVEPIFYTIGSAYFNAGDYPKAIVAFKNYQAKFPKGQHTGERLLRHRPVEFAQQEFHGCGGADGGVGERSPTARASPAFRGRSS